MIQLVRAALIAFAVSSVCLADGPFGFEQGMSLAQIQALIGTNNIKHQKEEFFTAIRAPKPHPQIESYMLIIDPEVGLVKVTGWTKDIDNDAFGSSTRDIFDQFKSALVQNYGEHEYYDFLKHGSLWKERQYWMMSLKSKERLLSAIWPKKAGDPLKNNVSWIILEAVGFSQDTGAIKLMYEFSNFPIYSKKREDKAASSL